MNILFNLIFFLYFFLPFQFALSPAAGFDIAIIRVLILLISLYYFAVSLLKRNLFIPKGWIISLFTLFSFFTLFSMFYTIIPIWTIRKLFFLLSFFSLVLILPTLFLIKPTSLEKLLKATILGAALISLIGIIQVSLQFIFPIDSILLLWSKLTPFFLGGTFSESVITHNSWLVNVSGHTILRAIAFFPDPHIFSFYLELVMPFSLAFYFISKQKYWLFVFYLLLLADLLTFSRGGYIGLFFGFSLGLILLWPKIKTTARHFIFLFFISLIFISLIPNNPISSRFISSIDSSDTSNSHRIELWIQAIEEIKKKPLFGTGLGAYPITINPLATYRTPIYVHNVFLDICVELGFIGLLLFLLVFIRLIFVLYKNKNNYISLFAIISICMFFIHSLFDTAIFSVHVFPLLLLLISIGIYYENKK